MATLQSIVNILPPACRFTLTRSPLPSFRHPHFELHEMIIHDRGPHWDLQDFENQLLGLDHWMVVSTEGLADAFSYAFVSRPGLPPIHMRICIGPPGTLRDRVTYLLSHFRFSDALEQLALHPYDWCEASRIQTWETHVLPRWTTAFAHRRFDHEAPSSIWEHGTYSLTAYQPSASLDAVADAVFHDSTPYFDGASRAVWSLPLSRDSPPFVLDMDVGTWWMEAPG